MNRQQFKETIKKVISSPRSDLQKISMIENAFELYVKEETDRIEREFEENDYGYCWMCGGGIDCRTAIDIVRKGGVE